MKTSSSANWTTRRGSALALSLAIVSVVALLSAMMLQLSSAHWKREATAVDQKRAFYIAEAGISEAIWGILQGESGIVGSQELPVRFGDGVYWTTAHADDHGIVHLESTAMCGQARAKLALAVEFYYQNALSLGAFSGRHMTIGAGAFIDAYDSKAGPYVPIVGGLVGTTAQVGANGNITVSPNRVGIPTTVCGDLTPGADHSVTAGLGTLVLGSTAPREEPQELPPIEIPNANWFGPMAIPAGASGTLPSGSYAGPNMTVGTNGVGTIVGPAVVVVDTLTLSSGATLRVDPQNGPVEIYVRNGVTTAATSKIQNLRQNPRGLQLWLDMSQRTGGVLSLAHTGPFHGSIYAPLAQLTLPASAEFFGSVVAGELSIAANAKVHLDVSAGDLGETTMTAQVLNWRPVAVPRELLRDLRFDPIADFEQRGINLPKPADAHDPIEIAVQYVDHNGDTVTYRGSEAGFDRSQIAALIDEVTKPLVRPINQIGRLRTWTDIDSDVLAALTPVKRGGGRP